MKKNKFQLKREATYANLIKAGIAVLCEKGYSSSSIDDVVSRAGYTKGAFYVHFESKEQFFLHLVDYRAESREMILESVKKLPTTGVTLEQAVFAIASGMVNYLIQSPEWMLVHMDFFIQAKRSELIQSKYTELYERWIKEGAAFIELLKSRQLVASDLDSSAKAKMMYAFLDGCIIHHVFYKEMLNETVIAEAFVKILQEQ
ncbi:MAG: TetR/AcrR family transcriptional regulator [Clostridia bacterium]